MTATGIFYMQLCLAKYLFTEGASAAKQAVVFAADALYPSIILKIGRIEHINDKGYPHTHS
jgi:hypothetical protein